MQLTILESKRQGTSNLLRHMKTAHRISHLPETTATRTSSTTNSTLQKSVIEMLNNGKPVKISITVEQAVCDWIIETMQPFVVVESRAFQRILRWPMYNLKLSLVILLELVCIHN
jgi:hypothetical protein